jgi:hypothetical protein
VPRRNVQPAALSFLDTLSNGFGAIVLLYVILTARSAQVADASLIELKSEQAQLEAQASAAARALARARGEADSSDSQVEQIEQENERIEAALADARSELEALERSSRNTEQLERELAALEARKAGLSAADPGRGRSLRRVRGEGERQYLTGLRLGGKRILILVDRSASMLDETVVNVIRTRNLPRAEKLLAPKWQRTVATVDWLTAQLPSDSVFQIYAFNTAAAPVLPESKGWLPADERRLDEAVRRLRDTVPEGGTSLHAAMEVIQQLEPPPDNAYLLVDGLPTQGKNPAKGTVTGPERLEHFRDATRKLPEGTALHVILFPMEGDPAAAPEYWWLSQLTGGSFLVPSRDWP